MSCFDSYLEFEKMFKTLELLGSPFSSSMGITTQLDKLQPPIDALYSTTSERALSGLLKSLDNTNVVALSSSMQAIVNISSALNITAPYSDYKAITDSIGDIATSTSVFSFLDKYRIPVELSYPSNFINSVSSELTKVINASDLDALSIFNDNYMPSLLDDIEEFIYSDIESKPQILKRILKEAADYIDSNIESISDKISIAINIFVLVSTLNSSHIALECHNAQMNSNERLIECVEHFEEEVESLNNSFESRFSYLRSVSLSQYVNEQNACIYQRPSNVAVVLGKLPLGAIIQLAEVPPENGYRKVHCWVPATGKFVSGWMASGVLEIGSQQ